MIAGIQLPEYSYPGNCKLLLLKGSVRQIHVCLIFIALTDF
jgi:hypothetical protein